MRIVLTVIGGEVRKETVDVQTSKSATTVTKLFEKEFFARFENSLEEEIYVLLSALGEVGLVETTICPVRGCDSLEQLLIERDSRIDSNVHLVPPNLIATLAVLDKEKEQIAQILFDKMPEIAASIMENLFKENEVFKQHSVSLLKWRMEDLEKGISLMKPSKSFRFCQNLNFFINLPYFKFRCGFMA